MIDRKVERVQIRDLKYESGVVFYGLNPDDHNNDVLPEYMTTTNRGGHEWVWVVFFTEKNPYIKPTPDYQPINAPLLRGLINSLESDWF